SLAFTTPGFRSSAAFASPLTAVATCRSPLTSSLNLPEASLAASFGFSTSGILSPPIFPIPRTVSGPANFHSTGGPLEYRSPEEPGSQLLLRFLQTSHLAAGIGGELPDLAVVCFYLGNVVAVLVALGVDRLDPFDFDFFAVGSDVLLVDRRVIFYARAYDIAVLVHGFFGFEVGVSPIPRHYAAVFELTVVPISSGTIRIRIGAARAIVDAVLL